MSPLLRCKPCADRGASAAEATARHCDKALRQGAAIRHRGKPLRKGTMESTAVRCCYKALRQGTVACTAARRRCVKILQQGTTARQCGRRCAAYGKTLRQDTAARHYGKAMRQALREDSSEGTEKTLRFYMCQGTTAKHCGRHNGKKTP